MSDLRLLQRIQTYDKDWCYQYQKRLDTLAEDMREYNWTEEDIKNISLDDFKFSYIDSEVEKYRATKFIERYEWLGTVGSFPNLLVVAENFPLYITSKILMPAVGSLRKTQII